MVTRIPHQGHFPTSANLAGWIREAMIGALAVMFGISVLRAVFGGTLTEMPRWARKSPYGAPVTCGDHLRRHVSEFVWPGS